MDGLVVIHKSQNNREVLLKLFSWSVVSFCFECFVISYSVRSEISWIAEWLLILWAITNVINIVSFLNSFVIRIVIITTTTIIITTLTIHITTLSYTIVKIKGREVMKDRDIKGRWMRERFWPRFLFIYLFFSRRFKSAFWDEMRRNHSCFVDNWTEGKKRRRNEGEWEKDGGSEG